MSQEPPFFSGNARFSVPRCPLVKALLCEEEWVKEAEGAPNITIQCDFIRSKLNFPQIVTFSSMKQYGFAPDPP